MKSIYFISAVAPIRTTGACPPPIYLSKCKFRVNKLKIPSRRISSALVLPPHLKNIATPCNNKKFLIHHHCKL